MTTLLAGDKSGFSKVHKLKPDFQCEYPNCQKSYTRKYHLDEHVLSYHEKRRFQCDYPDCLKSYTDKRTLEDHVASYHENRGFHCKYPDCQKVYTTNSDLRRHVLKKHTKKRFDTIAVLEAHLADIDSQIETVAALISGFDSIECEDCFLNK